MVRTMRPTLRVIPNRGSQLMGTLPINTATQDKAAWTTQWDYLKGGREEKEKEAWKKMAV